MRTKLVLAVIACAALVTGCSTINSVLTPSTVQSAVDAGAYYAIQADPSVGPYLAACQPVICSLSGSTTIDPSAIVAALENSTSANALKTPAGLIALNTILGIYEGVYYAYGTNVQASVLETYLKAVCTGLTQALTPGSVAMPRSVAIVLPPKNWPHVK